MNPYLKYTGLGFQLLFFIFAGYFIGKWASSYLGINETSGSAFGALFFLTFGLYKMIREVMKESEEKDHP